MNIATLRRKRQLHKKKIRVTIGFFITMVLTLCAAGIAFSKYYAGQSNKGVAIASSLYFTSNVLKNVGNTTEGGSGGDYPIIYNTESWDGTGECIFDVNICNYQNQLLYNDNNLDIVYNIKFELIGQSDGGIYTVTNENNETKNITEADTDAVFSNITLRGGMARTHKFRVSVTRPEAQQSNPNYRSVGIRVTATPVSPSYVVNTGTLGGVLYATMVSIQYSLEYNFDKVTSVTGFSGFPCTIKYMPDEDNAAHEVKIKWSSDLQIDQFNQYYNQAKAANKVGTEDIDGNIWNNMTIEMQPYSVIQIAFYRNSVQIDSIDKLNGCVKVEDLTKNGAVNGNE